LRSPELSVVRHAPLRPLLAKELWDVLSGRALWTMLLLLCPLIGYSFVQAVALYSEASAAALEVPVLARGLSPLDGVLVPTLGAWYVGTTLLFPFVAIRVLSQEKESGALRLLVQLPYRSVTLVAVKLAAVLAAWGLASLPAVSALALWGLLGGHVALPETLNLLVGHLCYGALVGALALCAAAVADSAATAAILTLAGTIGSWVLDFTLAGQPGVLAWIAGLSLTQTLRPFEQGLLMVGLVVGIAATIGGCVALAAVWLPPGVPVRAKLARSLGCILGLGIVLGLASRMGVARDVTEDQRNSFPAADQRVLAQMTAPLVVTVHLAPEDPRYADLQRNVLAKLARTLPHVTVRLASGRHTLVGSAGEEAYGEVEYAYGARTATSRSTSPREVLPLLYGLAQVPVPTATAADEYPGYPCVANAQAALCWFCGGLPLVIGLTWWWTRRPPRLDRGIHMQEISHADR
jgi:ABC-type transport system involved in multi-copper enzyme maturation permease subunit